MPEKTAIKTNNYAIMPISTILALAWLVLLFLKGFGILSIPWWVVFSPIMVWLGIVVAAGIVFVAIIGFIALIQIWK